MQGSPELWDRCHETMTWRRGHGSAGRATEPVLLGVDDMQTPQRRASWNSTTDKLKALAWHTPIENGESEEDRTADDSKNPNELDEHSNTRTREDSTGQGKTLATQPIFIFWLCRDTGGYRRRYRSLYPSLAVSAFEHGVAALRILFHGVFDATYTNEPAGFGAASHLFLILGTVTGMGGWVWGSRGWSVDTTRRTE